MQPVSGALLAAVVLGWAFPLCAADLILTFDFPIEYTPAPASFLVTVLSANAPTEQQQFRLPNLGRVSCGALPPSPTITPNTICGRPPACLSPGLYSFSVQAEWSNGTMSGESNLANCEALPGCTYDCAGGAIPPELQALVRTPPGGGEPIIDQAEAQRTVQTLAHQTTGTTVVSVTTAIPTVADILDKVQPALQALPRTPV